MKAENNTTDHSRTIRFHDLPQNQSGLTELTVRINYVGDSTATNGIALDHVVVPAIISAFHPQTIVIKEVGTMPAAVAYLKRKEKLIESRWKGKVKTAIGLVDDGCVHVELIGNFGQTIDLSGF